MREVTALRGKLREVMGENEALRDNVRDLE